MRISQKLEYACRALAQLAKRHDGKTITRLEELAQREGVSANFLVQILNDLRRSGLVASRRGKAGGYLLARTASQITLHEIVSSVDPAVLESSATPEGDSGPAVRDAWASVSSMLDEQLRKITLDQLAVSPTSEMFYI